MDYSISYFGTQLALSEVGTKPTSEDRLGNIESIADVKCSVTTVSGTSVSDTDGFERLVPLLKSMQAIPIVVFKNNKNYKRIYERFFGYSTAEKGFYCRLTIVWPRLADWTDVKDLSMDGFISEVTLGKADSGSAQTVAFTFQPIGKPENFEGFLNINGLTATPSTLDATGGDVTIEVTGTDLYDGLTVKGYVNGIPDSSTIGTTSGSSTSQTSTVTVPANSSGEEKTYVFKVSGDNFVTSSTFTDTVVVSAE